MLYLLTLLAFCLAAAYIAAPLRARQPLLPVVATEEVASAPVAEAVASKPDLRWIVEVEAEAEILIARRRRQVALGNGLARGACVAWNCARCDRAMASGDRFCASCGAPRPE